MSERKKRVTVTIDPHLAAYAEQLVDAGKADSVSAVVNSALSERAERERRVARRWEEALAGATDDDRARAARMLARIDAQAGQVPTPPGSE
jgi:Arc/MetJ-type ribon-helix-helix transcriptional regulator